MITKRICVALGALAIASVAACSSSDAPSPGSASIDFLNATTDTLHFSVDGGVLRTIAPETVYTLATDSRWHLIVALQHDFSSNTSVQPTPGGTQLVQAHIRPDGLFAASAVVDTGAIPAPGTSKLRVIHLSATDTAVDIWRIQPGYPNPVRIMFPFAYEAVSEYVQAPPGSWTVIVTPKVETWAARSSPDPRDHAIASLTLDVAADQATTIAFVDDATAGAKLVIAQ